jgi:hypothetical protein
VSQANQFAIEFENQAIHFEVLVAETLPGQVGLF